jgi:hypothetical protein
MGEQFRSEVIRDYIREDVPPTNVATLVPAKTDAETAAEIRATMIRQLDMTCEMLNSFKARGFVVSFALAQDAFGRQHIGNLIIAKHF